jgi:hypothetical protein
VKFATVVVVVMVCVRDLVVTDISDGEIHERTGFRRSSSGRRPGTVFAGAVRHRFTVMSTDEA